MDTLQIKLARNGLSTAECCLTAQPFPSIDDSGLFPRHRIFCQSNKQSKILNGVFRVLVSDVSQQVKSFAYKCNLLASGNNGA